jgi:hypothetical protein
MSAEFNPNSPCYRRGTVCSLPQVTRFDVRFVALMLWSRLRRASYALLERGPFSPSVPA